MAKWQRVRVNIPKIYTPKERVAIANDIVQFSIARSKSGNDVNGESFPGYSEEYKKSRDFGIAGKDSDVNLTLSGEMLNEMDLISHKSGTLLIGYESGADINGKVEGNRIGSYGGEADPEKERDFLGISDEDLKTILKKYPKGTKEQKESTKQKAIDIVTSLRISSEVIDVS